MSMNDSWFRDSGPIVSFYYCANQPCVLGCIMYKHVLWFVLFVSLLWEEARQQNLVVQLIELQGQT